MRNLQEEIKELLLKFDEPELKEEIIKHGENKIFTTGDIIIDYGTLVKYFPLVLKGRVKVFKEDENNNELFLYYISAGEACAATFACFNKMSSIEAIADTEVVITLIPIALMETWIEKYPSWTRFILQSYQQRFEDVLQVLNEVAFNKLDERLMDYLEKQSEVFDTKSLKITHAQIATELNTSREVISRLLKKMEQDKIVLLKRNEIVLN